MNRSDFLSATAASFTMSALPGCARTQGAAVGAPSLHPTDVITIEETTWEVRPGLNVRLKTYGGSVPAKTLRYKSGEHAVIRVVNRTSEPQTVHWHGLIVSDAVDGVAQLGTPVVRPGEAQDYAFIVRPSGTRWYHAHMGEGLFSGMYGPLIIADPHERVDYDREIILMLGAFDARIPSSSSMRDERPPGSPDLTRPVMLMNGMPDMNMNGMPGKIGGPSMNEMDGRNMGMRDAIYAAYGINGKALGAGNPIWVKRGERIRFRIINANPTKTFRLALPGHLFEVTHLDGYAVPVSHKRNALDLGVSERIDAIVSMDTAGVWILGSTVANERARGLGVVIAYDGARGPAQWVDGARDTFRYSDFGHAGTDPTFDCRYDLTLRKSNLARDAWSINGALYPHTAPLDVAEGRSYLLRFRNRSMMEHPMHLHGHGFELMRVDGVPTSGIFKDTVTIRPMGGAVDVLLRADNPYRGRFLLHCHNEQHMQGGMATVLRYR